MSIHPVSLSGGVSVNVEEEGSGPAALLLHAGVSERHMWDPQWHWLPDRHRTVRWDWRGYGDTPHVPGPFSYADDVIRIMDGLDIERATLIGCSFAGGVEIQVAVEHPDRVERLVLVSSGIPGLSFEDPPDVAALFTREEEAWNRDDVSGALSLVEQIWLIGPRRQAEAVDAAYLGRARELLWRADQPDNGAVPRDTDWSVGDRLSSLGMPVLVIVGSEDVPSVIEASRHAARVIPHTRFHRVPGAAHLPNLEKAALFDGILRDWLKETAAPPS